MTPDLPAAESAPTRRSRRSPAAPVAAETGTEVDVSEVALVEPAAVITPAVPLTRRQLREMAARESARTDAEPIVADNTLIAPVLATAAIPTVAPAADAVSVKVEDLFLDAAEEPETPVLVDEEEIPDAEFVQAVQADGHTVVDEFEAAARLFAFTGETPVQVAAAAIDEEQLVAEETVATAAPRRRRFSGAAFKRATAASATIGAMGIVGLLAVGMTTPAEAVAAASGTAALGTVSLASDVAPSSDEIQAYVAPADAQLYALDRSDYSTESMAVMASTVGVTNPSDFYTNDPNAAIQWPFAVGVSISYGFGPRSGGFHEGADFTPGEGAHVQAIAAGTVRIATESGGAFGVTVLIDHVIDGKLVSTRYAHMLHGSLQVKEGDTVVAGEYLGRTGNTGRSFGAHTHVEVLQNGTTPIDPIAWLRANAGRKSLDGE